MGCVNDKPKPNTKPLNSQPNQPHVSAPPPKDPLPPVNNYSNNVNPPQGGYAAQYYGNQTTNAQAAGLLQSSNQGNPYPPY